MKRMRARVWLLCIGIGGLAIGWGFLRLGGLLHSRTSTASVPTSVLPAKGVGPPLMPEEILVDDFEVGQTQGLFAERKNRLDAFQGTWARRPSYTIITKVPDTRQRGRVDLAPSSGKVLRIEYSKTGGWCGWYTLLNGIDVSHFNALTFWVNGERGGERFDIGLADHRMQDLQIDAVYAGPIMAFLPNGVTTQWQRVAVPLAGLRSDIDMTRMGSLVLWFRYEGKGAIQIDDVTFVNDPDVERIAEENAPRAAADSRAPRFSWVWKYDPVNNQKVREELLAFCKRTAIETLFIYLGEDPIPQTPPEFQKGLAEFLREAHAIGLKVESLQGNPLWALKANHPQVASWVRGYLTFNRSRPAAERIDGASLDIEPYLTTEWESGDRERLKSEFVELLTGLRRIIDSERGDSDFRIGVAIPVFYNREPEFEEALLKQVDYAALMDYYDTAVDIIQNARFHIDLADRLGKEMVIGVETQDLVQMGQGKRRNTFHEEGWEEMDRQLEMVVEQFADSPSFGGIAIHAYDSYRLLQKGRNVPTRERTEKVPDVSASKADRPVAIDGDLTDWAGASWMTFNQKSQVLYGAGAWIGPRDMSFKVAIQWEPEALLLAFDVTDDAVVQEKQRGDMWEGDHAEVWIDADLEGDFNEAVNSSDDFQFGLSPGNFGQLKPEAHLWVPSVDPALLGQVAVGAQRSASGYTLEARIPSKVLFQNEVLASQRLRPGFRLGVMIDGSDTDNPRQPQKCLLSSSPERQWGDPTTFNVLELK